MSIKSQDIKLNVVPGGIIPVVHVSQYDVDRELKFNLLDGNSAASIPSGTTVTIEGTKPDGHGFQYAGSISNNVVTVNTTVQMTVLAGSIECKLTLTKNSQRIGTALFIMDVEQAGLNETTDVSDTDLPLIIAEATEQMERAEAAATAAALSETHAATSETNAATSETNAATSEANAASSETNAAASATSASTDAASADVSATNANRDALKSEGHAVGQQNGADVSSDSPYFQNNAKYYALVAEQYAHGGLIYKGSVLFANIPTTGMSSGDLYNIEDDFTTDSRFQEGAGILVKAGADIAWNGSKWDVLAASGVTGVKGNAESSYRQGNVNLTPANIGALATNGDGKDVTVTYTTKDAAANTTEKTNTTTDQPSTIAKLTSGETLASMFGKISAMFKNIRKLWNTVGTTALNTDLGQTITAQLNTVNNRYNYSTTEQLVGKWNGNNLYCRIFTGTINVTGSEVRHNLLTNNNTSFNWVNCYGAFKVASGDFIILDVYTDISLFHRSFRLRPSAHALQIAVGDDNSVNQGNGTYNVTVFYTKSTT